MSEQRERLLAVSDLLVLIALERAFARVVPRSLRPRVSNDQRHRGYEIVPIREDKVDAALTNAWVLCPVLASRNRFPVDVDAWVQTLDSYTRSLLAMCEAHTPSRLRPALEPLLADAVEVPALRSVR